MDAHELDEWRRKYNAQRAQAAKRGIGWEFDFPTWLEVWTPYADRRGPGKDGLCMCRIRDRGPYALGNVYIATVSQNGHDVKLHNRYNGRSHGSSSGASGGHAEDLMGGSYAMSWSPERALVKRDAMLAKGLDEFGDPL